MTRTLVPKGEDNQSSYQLLMRLRNRKVGDSIKKVVGSSRQWKLEASDTIELFPDRVEWVFEASRGHQPRESGVLSEKLADVILNCRNKGSLLKWMLVQSNAET